MTIFVLSTPFIGVGSDSIYYWIFYLLGQTWGWDSYYFCTLLVFADMFNLRAQAPIFFLSFILSFSFLFSLQYLSKFITHLYYCLMLWGEYSDSFFFCCITLFISYLNFSINGLPLYLLPLAAFLILYKFLHHFTPLLHFLQLYHLYCFVISASELFL